MDWKTIASACQAGVLDSIPAKWKLATPTPASMTNVLGVPEECGLLTAEQLRITAMDTSALAAAIRGGSLTSVAATEAFCARAAIAHQCVNCLTAFFPDEALSRAAELDEILAKTGKPVGPLHGVPVAIKDYLNMKGKTATSGVIAWHDQIAESDASVVSVLKAAGAIPFARTTMPQTGMMLQTVSNLWGRTCNPYNRAFVSGGSSGGDGVLVAMHGSPFTPSTDIGGSIRAPAAFNGVYGIRPTADRIPKQGMVSAAPGQVSIKVSCGPLCHSMADLELVTRVLLEHPSYIGYEPTAVPFPYKEDVKLPKKLCFGFLRTDGVVTPQPPILRAMNETAEKLKAAGHEVIEFTSPVDLWEVGQTTWKLYFQTGAKEIQALVAQTGEPLTENFEWYLKTFNITAPSVKDIFKCNVLQGSYKNAFIKAWQATKSQTSTGRPIDGLICPCAPSPGFPHEFPVWWGYFSLWNILDYPSTILPLKGFRTDAAKDPKDMSYKPLDNVFDKMNYDLYDPELFKTQPVTLQIVRPPFQDEELLAVTGVVDEICNK